MSPLLVASDFDGVLAPLVDNPAESQPHPTSLAALRTLAALPDTRVAIVSGRELAVLRHLSTIAPDEPITLVGSHGSEFDHGLSTPLTAAHRELLQRTVAELETIAARHPGVVVEVKPASTTLHVRQASPAAGAAALDEVRRGPATWDGIQATAGKLILELAVIETSKGSALDTLRTPGEAVIYLGDDVTDEKAFAVLRPGDTGIKVGEGDSLASTRLADPEAVAAYLDKLATARAASR